MSATNYVLEATTSLPAVSWTTVTNTLNVTATNRSVQPPLTGNARCFRLRQPCAAPVISLPRSRGAERYGRCAAEIFLDHGCVQSTSRCLYEKPAPEAPSSYQEESRGQRPKSFLIHRIKASAGSWGGGAGSSLRPCEDRKSVV